MRPREEWAMWLRAKLRAGRDVIAAKLRVDETQYRLQKFDALPDLIKMIAAAKASNPHLEL